MKGIYNNNNLIKKNQELKALLNIIKYDSNRNEVKEYFKQQNELEEILKVNDLLEGVDIKCIESLERFASRTWLFKYKERGYVLWDNSNGHYSYLCTAEDFLYGLEPEDTLFDGEEDEEEENEY